MTQLSTDLHELHDGARVLLHPNAMNPLHKKPTHATYDGGYFYCEGTAPELGPDYYFGDVLSYHDGWEVLK